MISAYVYFRLGCLMQQFLPHVILNGSLGLQEMSHRLDLSVSLQGRPVRDDIRVALRQRIKPLMDECVKLQFNASFASLDRILITLNDPNGTWSELREWMDNLERRLIDELKLVSCFALEGHAQELYQAERLFGTNVADRFAAVVVDIEEAGKCLALDRATACVFHLMRVLDHGLQRLATDLGIGKLQRSWHLILQDVETAIGALPRSAWTK